MIKSVMMGYEATAGIEAFAHKACAALTLKPVTIIWSSTIKTAAISSSGTVYLATIMPDQIVSRALFLRYVGYVVHELLHRAFTNFQVNGKGSYVQTLHNAVEDAWIERKAISTGLMGNIDQLLSALIEGMTHEALATVGDWANPAQYPYALAVYCRPHAPTKVPLANGLGVIFEEANRRIDTCTSSADTLAVAEWVFKQLNLPKGEGNGQGPEPKQGEGQEQGQGKGDGKGESKGESKGQGNGNGEGKGEGKGGGNGKAVGPSKAPKDGRDTVATKVEPGCPQASGAAGHGGTYSNQPGEVRPFHVPAAARPLLPVNGAKMRREIKTLLENSGYEQHDQNRRAGSVNINALHRVDYDDRLFTRRTEVEGVDSAVFILIDNSGSMSQQIESAVAVASALYAASMAAQAATKVATFNYHRRESDWNVSVPRMNKILSHINVSGGTEDYQSLRWASNDLLQRQEQRKVLIIITDGNGDRDSCKQWAASLDRLGMIVIGVGVGVSLGDIYKHNVRVNSSTISDLTLSAVIKAIK